MRRQVLAGAAVIWRLHRAGVFQSGSLTGLVHGCWQAQEASVALHMGLSLGCWASCAHRWLSSKQPIKEETKKVQPAGWPSLRSLKLLPLPFPIGDADESWVSLWEHYTGVWILEGTGRWVPLGGWLPQQQRLKDHEESRETHVCLWPALQEEA